MHRCYLLLRGFTPTEKTWLNLSLAYCSLRLSKLPDWSPFSRPVSSEQFLILLSEPRTTVCSARSLTRQVLDSLRIHSDCRRTKQLPKRDMINLPGNATYNYLDSFQEAKKSLLITAAEKYTAKWPCYYSCKICQLRPLILENWDST